MLGETIQRLRKQRGMTQEELAIRLHVVRQTVSKWEKGLSVPDAAMLQKLAEELEVTVGELLGGERQPEPEPDQNALAQQMARISEQLAVRNRREKRIWTVVAIVVGLGILIPILFMAISASGLFYRPMSGSSANYVIGMPTQDPVFSQDEVRNAMDSISTVFQKEKTWKGCTLVRMTYEESQCVAAAEKLAEEYGQGQVLAIYVTFTTGEKRVPEGLEPNKTYWDQPWFLIRSGSGWQVVR